nr:unnamed protein product [Digitaria exilis]
MVVGDLEELEDRLGRQLVRHTAPGRRRAISAPPHAGSGLLLSGCEAPSLRKLAAAAGIREVVLTPTRASPRLAGVADQHALEKAKSRAAWRNLDRPVS